MVYTTLLSEKSLPLEEATSGDEMIQDGVPPLPVKPVPGLCLEQAY